MCYCSFLDQYVFFTAFIALFRTQAVDEILHFRLIGVPAVWAFHFVLAIILAELAQNICSLPHLAQTAPSSDMQK